MKRQMGVGNALQGVAVDPDQPAEQRCDSGHRQEEVPPAPALPVDLVQPQAGQHRQREADGRRDILAERNLLQHGHSAHPVDRGHPVPLGCQDHGGPQEEPTGLGHAGPVPQTDEGQDGNGHPYIGANAGPVSAVESLPGGPEEIGDEDGDQSLQGGELQALARAGCVKVDRVPLLAEGARQLDEGDQRKRGQANPRPCGQAQRQKPGPEPEVTLGAGPSPGPRQVVASPVEEEDHRRFRVVGQHPQGHGSRGQSDSDGPRFL